MLLVCSDRIPILGIRMYRSGWSPKSGLQVPFWYPRYGVTIRDAIHKLLQKTSVLLQNTTVQMLINVKVRTYNEARGYPELGQP